MPDRTWAPEVVERVARSIESVCSDGNSDARRVAAAMLSASPLPAALDLIERMARMKFERANGFSFVSGFGDLKADAAAFVARVGGTK